ncbi:phospholipase D-like domain-containing protein [Steroidobacter cummioxidans]|uniref:phospholipase D-like domain-containing protein n=1 Tax=Steroidobacter cummioxidans TaxID=1803913 RepID=UPI000E321B7C|nr:phospholipase D-like domain-containing protein [Steroidobacter cummioxidans]
MWAGVLTFLAGALLASVYFLLKNRRNTPYLQLDLDALPALGDDVRTLAGLTEGAVTTGNACQILQDGALFPAMEADIAAAKCAVHLETFVWTAGTVERRFVELLSRKAREGIEVRVLIDAMGSAGGNDENLKRMAQAGVQLSMYCKPRWWNLRRFNHRTHRKLLIVDGAIGYTFGHGIADQWLGHGEDEKHWRDTAVRVEGPAVQALQSVFMENWIEESHRVPAGAGCFPELEAKGESDAHVVSSASGDAVSSVALLYTVAIACAKREVIIQNPYFAPDDGMCELLVMMVKRGVAVHLMLPGAHTDSPFVRRAGCRLYEQLLAGGVRLYEFMPTLIHQKIVIVDEVWSHIGSTNFDARSLSLNEEVGIGIRDAPIARQLKAAFENDLQRSRELTLDAWRRRPWYSRLFDWIAYQVHDQL